jgi:DNA (cytosine-5)-methyltransferase 1
MTKKCLRSIELFAGAGGLGMGVTLAGFKHDLVLEWNEDACNTIRENRAAKVEPVANWPECTPRNVREIDFRSLEGKLDLLSGGPPCQPFSLGGRHRSHTDERDMFPEVVRAVREAKPKAVLVENVKGLLRQSFANYFGYIELQLQYPDIVMRVDEDWMTHRSRLEQHHTAGKGRDEGLTYRVVYRLFNAANFGVPQRRERVIIVGIRSDLGAEWTFPQESHSVEALLYDQWVTGEYWERHKVATRDRPMRPVKFPSRFSTDPVLIEHTKQPWVTVRDAIADLPDPQTADAAKYQNHFFMDGARQYPGHTGSPLDEPAKTLKAGDHGVPGGENMLLRPDGSIRYFTVREAARLQTFPDPYRFSGSWSETMRQLGNAVPVKLGQVVASSIRGLL